MNGVLIDIDEFTEGWQTDVLYPPAPCHPLYCKMCGGSGRCPDHIESDCDDCPDCVGTGYVGGNYDCQERLKDARMNDANNAGMLLPCPFCKSRCVTATRDEHGWKIVECDDCGARGPCIDLDGDQYIDRWNALSTPNAPVEPATVQVEWLEDAARYFEARPTLGEDMAHWANVHNAEMCRKIAAILAVRLDEAAIRKDEREKLLNWICERLLVLADGWKTNPSKDRCYADIALTNAAITICGRGRIAAVRNGGKQP